MTRFSIIGLPMIPDVPTHFSIAPCTSGSVPQRCGEALLPSLTCTGVFGLELANIRVEIVNGVIIGEVSDNVLLEKGNLRACIEERRIIAIGNSRCQKWNSTGESDPDLK